MNDTKRRSLAKTISWRLTGSSATFGISYLISGDFVVAGSIASVQLVANTILYFIHERVWDRFKWGKATATVETIHHLPEQPKLLSQLMLPTRSNQCWEYSGIDSPKECIDKKHFSTYPHPILYQYNNRGYRDQDWPESIDELRDAIWCVGDSFTVGLGCPIEHTWPYILQQQTQTRTINVSLDGASNDWIARKAQTIINTLGPKVMVIHWSYISRREKNLEEELEKAWDIFYNNVRDASWPHCALADFESLPQHIIDEINKVHGGLRKIVVNDEDLRAGESECTGEEDVKHTVNLINTLNNNCRTTKIIHSFIPAFQPASLQGAVESRATGIVIPEFNKLDLARDGIHYDIATSRAFVQQIVERLSQ